MKIENCRDFSRFTLPQSFDGSANIFISWMGSKKMRKRGGVDGGKRKVLMFKFLNYKNKKFEDLKVKGDYFAWQSCFVS